MTEFGVWDAVRQQTLTSIRAICFWGCWMTSYFFLTEKKPGAETKEFPVFRIFVLRLPPRLAASGRSYGPHGCESAQ